jgi:hypothetical protein
MSLQVQDVNPFTKQPHSAQYKNILEARKKLPVYARWTNFSRWCVYFATWEGEFKVSFFARRGRLDGLLARALC